MAGVLTSLTGRAFTASRRLLGAQATGPGDGSKRIDVAAMAITAGMTVDQLANADPVFPERAGIPAESRLQNLTEAQT